MKCTTIIHQLAYDTVLDALDEHLQMGQKTYSLSIDHFYNSVMENFGREYLRKPIMTDVVKLYQNNKETHGAPWVL